MSTKKKISILRYAILLAVVFSITTISGKSKDKKNPVSANAYSESTNMLLEDATHAPTQFADIKDHKLAYRTVGKGIPMILCARFRGNLDSWDPAFLNSLAKEGYQVITFNYSGLASSTGRSAESALDMAIDVKDLASALGFKKFIVGGWSLGGFVAELVITEYPEIITHGILIATKPPGNVEYGLEEIFIRTAYKPSYTVEDETILFFEPTSAISTAAAIASHERIAKRTKDKDKVIEQKLWLAYDKVARDFEADPYNCRGKLMTTKIPILVISADHEVCFPPQNWYVLTRQLPTTQFLIIPQSGHGPHHQYPEFVAGFIADFTKQFK